MWTLKFGWFIVLVVLSTELGRVAATDMRIVLLGSGSIFVNLSGSSPNLKIFEAHYGLWGNIVASINSRLMKNGVNKVLFYDLCKHYLPILVLSRQYLFGSSTFSVWFRKRAARAANNSHICPTDGFNPKWEGLLSSFPVGNSWFLV